MRDKTCKNTVKSAERVIGLAAALAPPGGDGVYLPPITGEAAAGGTGREQVNVLRLELEFLPRFIALKPDVVVLISSIHEHNMGSRI